jgi:hypothetical protein
VGEDDGELASRFSTLLVYCSLAETGSPRPRRLQSIAGLSTPVLPGVRVHAPQRTEAHPFVDEATGAVRRQVGLSVLTGVHSGHQRRESPEGVIPARWPGPGLSEEPQPVAVQDGRNVGIAVPSIGQEAAQLLQIGNGVQVAW